MHYAQSWLQRQANADEVEALRERASQSEAAAWWKVKRENGIDQFLSELRDGDEIWKYCALPQTRQLMAGQAGDAIVRNGVVTHILMTRMN